MEKIQNHAYHNFCLSMMQKTFFLKKTCFKSKDKPSCIDLFITDSPNSFQNTPIITTGLSDFHKMVIIVFNEEKFKTDLKIL